MGEVRFMISEAAKKVQVESHVLRYWEEELHIPIGRTEMGHRYYTQDDIQLFCCIKKLKNEGVLLRDLKPLIPELKSTRQIMRHTENKEKNALTKTPAPDLTSECKPATTTTPVEVITKTQLEHVRSLIGEVLTEVVTENNKALEKEISTQVTADVIREMDFLFQAKERQEEEHFRKLDSLIRREIPAGMRVREKPLSLADEANLEALRCAEFVNLDYDRRSLGTLGGGNHFIEVDRDEDGTLYLILHSGSRRLGVEVAEYYQSAGSRALKEQGSDLPYALAYVSGDLFEDYLHDMKIVQNFAHLNRRAMADRLVRAMKLTVQDRFATIHNYIDTGRMILRKGAVSAQRGERILIPINMRDGSLLCTGLGNPDWNESAPHGAGRRFSRRETRDRCTLSEFKRQMAGVFTTSVSRETLDECPMAYKSMDVIAEAIAPTARIDRAIRPIYNFKAGTEG